MTFKDWNSLESEIKKRTALATQDTIIGGKEVLDNYLRYFYETRDPDRYERTYYLMCSGDYTYETSEGGGKGTIYMDDSVPYQTGTYSTIKVFQEAEVHGSRIIGNPFFWENTMQEIENNVMPNAFRKHGFIKK